MTRARRVASSRTARIGASGVGIAVVAEANSRAAIERMIEVRILPGDEWKLEDWLLD